jgi:hypothetical protein
MKSFAGVITNDKKKYEKSRQPAPHLRFAELHKLWNNLLEFWCKIRWRDALEKFWLKMSLACFEISARETQEKLHDRPRNDKRILRAGVDELIKRERLKQEEKRRI